MSSIRVDHHNLYYSDGEHSLRLSVEWSFAAKTADHPLDFEIQAGGLNAWTDPPGKPIDPARREQLLDELAAHYSQAPAADIIGDRGELLRGVSAYRFYYDIYPKPSRYYEIGKYLAIPATGPRSKAGLVLDFSGITRWTAPDLRIEPAHLALIAKRVTQKGFISVAGFA
ncbi:MAG: hypothetical protein U0Q16_21320 [Bryobacteraceae bacterium]